MEIEIGEGTVRQLRKEFADSCLGTLDTLTAVLRHEDNHIMQHTLHSLKGELEWAVREFGGKETK